MVIKENHNEFKAMKNLASDLGLEFRFDSIIHPRLDGSKSPCSVRLSPEEVVNLDLLDEKRVDEFRKSYKEFTPAASNEFIYNCGAGVDMFNINPYGFLQVCQMVTNPYVDLKKEKFVYGWQEVFPKIRLLNKKDESPCTGCIKQPLCARCPKWSELESGYPEAKVEYLCQVANLREQVFGLKQEKLCV